METSADQKCDLECILKGWATAAEGWFLCIFHWITPEAVQAKEADTDCYNLLLFILWDTKQRVLVTFKAKEEQ